MPAKPSYSHRLTAAITCLETHPHNWVDRKTLETLLGVSKTVAWRILRHAGAEPGPGNTLVCDRLRLLTCLREMAAGGVHQFEVQRRKRLEAFLEEIRPAARSRRIMAAGGQAAERMVRRKMATLPDGVTLTARSLTIDFAGMEQFLERFGAIVFALQNDYEEIRSLVGETAGEGAFRTA